MTSCKCFFNFLLGLNASFQHLSRQYNIQYKKRSYNMSMWAFANIISLWCLWVEERTQSIALSTPQEDICHFTFSQTLSSFSPPPLSGKMEFMSPYISLRQTEGYTQGLRRTYSKTKWLLLLCHFVYAVLSHVRYCSEAFFFSHVHIISLSHCYFLFSYFSGFFFYFILKTFIFMFHFPSTLLPNPLVLPPPPLSASLRYRQLSCHRAWCVQHMRHHHFEQKGFEISRKIRPLEFASTRQKMDLYEGHWFPLNSMGRRRQWDEG